MFAFALIKDLIGSVNDGHIYRVFFKSFLYLNLNEIKCVCAYNRNFYSFESYFDAIMFGI